MRSGRKRLRMIEMERWDKGGVTEGWRQRGRREAAGGRGSARSDQTEPRRILKEVNNLRHLYRSSLSIHRLPPHTLDS